MGLFGGSVTYKKFRLVDQIPGNFNDIISRNLSRFAFREINPKINPEVSIGWVNPHDPLDVIVAPEKVILGKYLLLGLRIDRKSVPSLMFKARAAEAIRAAARERNGRKLSREEINGLRETVKQQLLAESGAVTQVYDMSWNYETGEIYFTGTATRVVTEFAELFEQTFEVGLEEQNLVSRSEAFIYDKGLEVELIDIESAHFGR